ncbi:MAG: hypothetical protein ABSA69_06730 [Verrucomicrobiota bacterium]|jgi:hypothetical protein
MKTLAAFLVVVFVTVISFGQAVDLQVLKRAEALRDQNNARQGLSAPGSAPRPSPAPAQPDPVLAATLQNIASLQADLASLEIDPGRKQPSINDLAAAAQGAHASEKSVTLLAGDLAAALSGRHFSDDQLKKLAQCLHALFNSSHLSQTQQQTVLDAMRKTLQGGGVPPEDAATVVTDAKAVVAETK